MAELIGYLRISTKDQRLDLQQDALRVAGVADRYWYTDISSGSKQSRPGLAACLKALRPGDTLVTWRLDRLARSLVHFLEILQDLQSRQIGLKILEGVGADMNPATSEGKLFLSLLGAFAEFERAIIRDRVIAGLVAARTRGHKGGRRQKLSPAQQRQAQAMKEGHMSVTEIAKTLQCSRHTVYKALGLNVQVSAAD